MAGRSARTRDGVGPGAGLAWLLGILGAMGPLSTDMHLPGVPDLAASLDTTDALAAATVPVCFAGFALGQLVVGGLTDRWGRRRPILVCLALFTLTGALCALAPTIEMLLVVRFFQGVAGAGTLVAVRAAVRDHATGTAASKLYSQMSMVSMLAPIFAPLLGGQVLRFTSWRGLFWAFTLISALLFVLALVKFRESLPPERRRAGGGHARLLLRVLRHPGFGQHVALALCQGVILFSYITMSSLYLRDSHGLGPQQYSLVYALNGAGMVLSHFVNSRFVTRWGALNTLTGSVIGYSIGCTMLLASVVTHAPLPLVICSLFVVMTSLTASMPNNMALSLVPFGAAAGTASALLGASQQAAGAVVPPLALAIGTSGLVMALTMFVAAVLGLVQVLAVVRPALRSGQERPAFE